MKILWLVNIIMPELARVLEKTATVCGGWLTGAMQILRNSGHSLIICTTADIVQTQRYEIDGSVYYLLPYGDVPQMQASFQSVLAQEQPDLIHIYGTEFPHCWALASIADPERTIVTIQGALKYYEKATYAGLPEKQCRDTLLHKTLRKLHKGGISIDLQRQLFQQRAVYEEKTLKRLKYINGGSGWGNAVAKSIHPDCVTLDCGLILRDSFYTQERWRADQCEKHSIYVLLSYPIKGFHRLLDVLPMIIRRFPDTKVYVASNKLVRRNYTGLKAWIMDHAPDYQWLLQRQIDRLNLSEHLVFLDSLSEKQVRDRLLKSNVFVSPASIENQSTALGEAMMLGVPCVASGVGAIMEMIDHGRDGFVYPFGETYLLAEFVCRIFEDDALAAQFSELGHAHAAKTYSREDNGKKLTEMYETVLHRAGKDRLEGRQ